MICQAGLFLRHREESVLQPAEEADDRRVDERGDDGAHADGLGADSAE